MDEGCPEVPADNVPRVDEELFANWTIETEPGPDERVVSSIAVLASERDDRIARCRVDQDERQNEESGDRGQRLPEASEQIPAAHPEAPGARSPTACRTPPPRRARSRP